jgi:hypothetical protein
MSWDISDYWTYAQTSLLWELSRTNSSLAEISARIGKAPEQIRIKAAELGINLLFDHSEGQQIRTKGA